MDSQYNSNYDYGSRDYNGDSWRERNEGRYGSSEDYPQNTNRRFGGGRTNRPTRQSSQRSNYGGQGSSFRGGYNRYNDSPEDSYSDSASYGRRWSRGRQGYGDEQNDYLGGQGEWHEDFDYRGNDRSSRFGNRYGGSDRHGYGSDQFGGESTGNHGYGSQRTGYGRYSEDSSYQGHNGGSRYGRRFGEHSGKGPKGYSRSDDQIKEEACQCLEQEGEVDASEINVSCQNGIITLEGTVQDREMKRSAEECLEDVYGLKDVMNKLEVEDESAKNSKGSSKNRSGSSESRV